MARKRLVARPERSGVACIELSTGRSWVAGLGCSDTLATIDCDQEITNRVAAANGKSVTEEIFLAALFGNR